MGFLWNLGSCLLVVAGASGVVALLQYRHSLSHKLLSWRIRKLVRTCKRQVYVVQNEATWTEVLPLLLREVHTEGALGMDCEWVEIRGRRRPVALLQLASCSGVCVLVHLAALRTPFPLSLQNLLEDSTIIKAGVGIIQDKRFLEADYGLKVQSCVDLRHLVLWCHKSGSRKEAIVSSTAGLGLATLSLRFLGRTLDKDWRVRASDWEAEDLTERQKSYAAEDALAGIQLLMVLWTRLWTSGGITGTLMLPLLPSSFFLQCFMTYIYGACHRYLDFEFSNSSSKSLHQDDGLANQQAALRKVNRATRAYCPRRNPLYHNCQLLAPDDFPLCTCDPKKAKWYVEKGLGVVVQHDPMVVRLNFEPAGRPRLDCEDERYYVQERQNMCVVCGQEYSYIKKNVVPHEYRKHFPSILKDHQSHDVVLLCIQCHRVSNAHDAVLKDMLARECNAPLGQEGCHKVTVNTVRKTVRNAAWALLRNRPTIPELRVGELESIIKAYLKVDVVSQELLEEAASIDAREWNEDYQTHGQQVCEAYRRKSLLQLQRRWRRHFLDTMQPKHLPQYWSVTHNFQKMWSIMAELPQDHPDFETYKIILAGTESTSNVQHII